MVTIIAKTDKIEGLETWLPQRNSTMHLCEKQSGPFVRIEAYRKVVKQLSALARCAGASDSEIIEANMPTRSTILAALRDINRARKSAVARGSDDRALYGAQQALGWAAGLDYMNPARVLGQTRKEALVAKRLFGR
jgi:hypothetical protein